MTGPHDDVVLVVEAVLVALQAAWLTLGAYTNLKNPVHNQDYVQRVLTMELIREDSPQDYEAHRGRRVTSPAALKAVFPALVTVETLVSVALWIGAALLIAAAGNPFDQHFGGSPNHLLIDLRRDALQAGATPRCVVRMCERH